LPVPAPAAISNAGGDFVSPPIPYSTARRCAGFRSRSCRWQSIDPSTVFLVRSHSSGVHGYGADELDGVPADPVPTLKRPPHNTSRQAARFPASRFCCCNIGPELVDGAAPRAILAECIPSRVFKKYSVKIIEAVVVADITRKPGGIGTVRRHDRANVYFFNPHYALANVSKDQWQQFCRRSVSLSKLRSAMDWRRRQSSGLCSAARPVIHWAPHRDREASSCTHATPQKPSKS
jgi:hypothetical protein